MKEIELIYPVRFPLREIIERRRILLEKSSLDAPLDDERGVMGLDSQRLEEDESASGTTSDAHTRTDASSMEDLDVMSDFKSDIPSDSANTTGPSRPSSRSSHRRREKRKKHKKRARSPSRTRSPQRERTRSPSREVTRSPCLLYTSPSPRD